MIGPLDWDDPEADAEVHRYVRDEKIDEAKAAVLSFLNENASQIFFERQLAIIFERAYFHWITVKALHELVREGSIETDLLPLAENVFIRFVRMATNRYWKRSAARIIELVQSYSKTEFTHAVGNQGELLVDAALPQAGFTPFSRNARSYDDKTWISTGHDLDRIVLRDGIAYGVEIKNTLPYIPKDELEIKISMCRYLGLVPLFVSRMAPKNYNFQINQAGGISWILGTQFYPLGHQQMANTIREESIARHELKTGL